jgi:hypothetical protein
MIIFKTCALFEQLTESTFLVYIEASRCRLRFIVSCARDELIHTCRLIVPSRIHKHLCESFHWQPNDVENHTSTWKTSKVAQN